MRSYAFADIDAVGDIYLDGDVTIEAIARNSIGKWARSRRIPLRNGRRRPYDYHRQYPRKRGRTILSSPSGYSAATAYASAYADLDDSGSVAMSLGPVTVEAIAINSADFGDNAIASANLYANANSGNLTITGPVNVTADAIFNGNASAATSGFLPMPMPPPLPLRMQNLPPLNDID